ncbi:hypothetical protein N7504_008455 [Penicillium tannophilum]|nr:hypothetical protein N7504_008455 [Penicillium tannophilum]
MSAKQILRSEAILEKYGKAISGKTILITGVSDISIAGELAIQLSTADPKLLILSARAESKVVSVIEKIRETKPNVMTRFFNMDLNYLSGIREAVEHDLADIDQIDHVICAAGVMACPYTTTKDGFEMQFGVNYLANFLLVKLLLPKVQAAGSSSSIISVASAAARQGKVDCDDIGFSNGKTYEPIAAYCQSNVARVMFAKKLSENLKGQGIRAYSIDPGSVTTGLQRHVDAEMAAAIEKLRKDGYLVDVDGNRWQSQPRATRSEGAATIITGMIDPTITDHNGAYLSQNALADDELHSHILDEKNWARLWELSQKLIEGQ